MNCKEFKSIVLVLDRDAGEGAAALAHASACEGCRAELNAINELRASLAALALQDASLEAPAEVEAALIRGLRESKEPVRPGFATAQGGVVPRLRLFLAVAAAILVFAIAVSIIYTRLVPKNSITARSPAVEQASPDPGTLNRDQPKSPDQAKSPDQPKSPDKPGISDPNKGSVMPDRIGSAEPGQLAGSREPDRSKLSRRTRRRTAGRDTADDYEIATDYFPISYGSYLQPVDSGQIVRIKLPRSALRSYGLPVDPMRADEAIKADVVIGNDGMARAIRFVH